MTSNQQYAEERMQQRWYDLAMAEQQGASRQVLERLYSAYMLAVEEFNRCSAVQPADQPQIQSRPSSRSTTQPRPGKRNQKAS
jgi:hypothetical protein